MPPLGVARIRTRLVVRVTRGPAAEGHAPRAAVREALPIDRPFPRDVGGEGHLAAVRKIGEVVVEGRPIDQDTSRAGLKVLLDELAGLTRMVPEHEGHRATAATP